MLTVAPATAALRHGTSPAWRPPILTATQPSSGVVDLAWSNVPGGYVTLFTFSTGGVCQFGCETRHPNTGMLEVDDPNDIGSTFGYEICSEEVQPQVCTNRVWLTLS